MKNYRVTVRITAAETLRIEAEDPLDAVKKGAQMLRNGDILFDPLSTNVKTTGDVTCGHLTLHEDDIVYEEE